MLGRLKARVNRWEEMGASDYILDTIRSGYKLPLLDTPEPRFFKNNKSAIKNSAFVSQAILELLESGRVVKVVSPPKVVNPLSVFENGEKKRLILDLRYVNKYLWKKHVKFEDFRTFEFLKILSRKGRTCFTLIFGVVIIILTFTRSTGATSVSHGGKMVSRPTPCLSFFRSV